MQLDVHRFAPVCSEEILRGLSDAELFALADSVGGVLGQPIVKDSDRGRAIERRLAGELTETYVADLLEVADRELEVLPASNVDPGQVNLVLAAIALELPDPKERFAGMLVEALEPLTLLARRSIRSLLRERGRNVRTVSASLTLADQSAVEILSEQQTWWIGDFFSNHLSRRITATVSHEAVTRGLGRVDVGRILHGIVEGTASGVSVPKTYRGDAGSYFEMLAGTVRNRASSFGSLRTMSDAEIERYRFEAVMDERTSEQCSQLHDRLFTVESGIALTDRVLGARGPEEVKEVCGWRTAEEIRQVIGGGDLASQTRSLTSAGLIVPPLHARCRSVLVPE